MAEQLHINAIGLVTDPNPLMLPPGALTLATNVVIKRPGVIEPRPGFIAKTGLSLPTDTTVVGAFAFDDDVILVLEDASGDRSVYVLSDSHEITQTGDLAGSTWGSSADAPIRAAEIRGNLYLTSAAGAMRITAASDTTAERAGLMRPGQPRQSTSTSEGVTKPLGADESVAYRICRAKAAGDVELRSPPSARVLERSYTGSSDKSVSLTFADTSDDAVTEVYRSTAFTEAYEDEPTDEMAMVGSAAASATSFRDDVAPLGLRGAALYTNDTQGGALLENGITPFCDDVATYAGMMFFGAATWAPALTFEIIAFRGGTTGTSSASELTVVQALCTTTLGSTTVEGLEDVVDRLRPGMRFHDAGEDPNGTDDYFSAETYIVSVGTDSIVIDRPALKDGGVQAEACDWVELEVGATTERVFMRDGTDGTNQTDVRPFGGSPPGVTTSVRGAQDLAYQLTSLFADDHVVVSAFGDGVTVPWTFIVESYAHSVESVTVRTSNPGATTDRIDSTTGKTATRLGSKATLAWSKPGEPEHVPPGYQVEIGATDKAIQRIVPTRDSLFVFKEDGVWRVSGFGPDSLQVSEFDRTVTLINPEACCAWAGGVAAWANKGVLLITEGGYQEIGAPIANELTDLEGEVTPAFKGCFLAGWTMRDLLIFGVPTSSGTGTDRVYAWCSRTNAWARWEHGADISSALAVDDELYFGCAAASGSSPDVLEVNDNGPDASYAVTVSAADGTAITIDSGSDWTPSIGDVLVSSETAYSVVEVASETAFTVDRAGVETGATTAETGFSCGVTWAVAGAQNPGAQHLWREAALLFGSAQGMDVMLWAFSTDRQQIPSTFTQRIGGYDTNAKAIRARSKVPRSARRGNRLYPTATIRHARQAWSIEALSIVHEPIDTRFAGA